jgi:hypothetical protein
MKDELKDYILRNYTYLLSEEARRLLNEMHSYNNLVLFEEVHGIDEMRDKYHLFEIEERQVAYFRGQDQNELMWNIAKAIYERHKDEIWLNACLVCGGLARTLSGRQCRNGHRW